MATLEMVISFVRSDEDMVYQKLLVALLVAERRHWDISAVPMIPNHVSTSIGVGCS